MLLAQRLFYIIPLDLFVSRRHRHITVVVVLQNDTIYGVLYLLDEKMDVVLQDDTMDVLVQDDIMDEVMQ